jgi:hypothetical protein
VCRKLIWFPVRSNLQLDLLIATMMAEARDLVSSILNPGTKLSEIREQSYPKIRMSVRRLRS